MASPLFSNRENPERYWYALIHSINNNKDTALALVNNSNVVCEPLAFAATDSFDLFLDKLFVRLIAHDPQGLSYLGLFEAIGIRDHNAFLNELTPQALHADLELKKDCVQALKNYEHAALTEQQRLSYAIIGWMLEHAVAGQKFLFHEYKLNQIFGVLSEISSTFTRYHRLETAHDAQLYVTRLQKIPQQLQEFTQLLEHQRNHGIVTPVFALEKVINTLAKTIPQEITQCFLYTHFKDHCSTIPGADEYAAQAQCILQDQVYPAYQRLLAYCQQLHAAGDNEHGVWALPDGDAYYQHCLIRHTTTNLTADVIHELGIQEVASIQKAMRHILAQIGIRDDGKKVGHLMQELAQDQKFYFPSTQAGRQQCLAHYEAILERCRKELHQLFDIKPKAPVTIEAVPAHEQEGQPAAYYCPPSMDGCRPGTFFANLRDLSEVPIYGMETLTVHEAEPGHHFQIALQQEMDMPIMRKLGEFTAYVEGWALYTEKLAYEQNFYSSPASQLGHLQDELLRAVRLVVDTGIHKKRWTRQQAIDYMAANTGYHLNNIVTEIERYFVMPGQACAYKIGQLKILELRARAKDALQNKFDIREFHNVVLSVGACPLTILESVVESYMRATLGN
jgi:uncharacterized protein (DUF885 family)